MLLKHKQSIPIVLCITFYFANGSLSDDLQKVYDDAVSNFKKFVGITTTKQPMSFINYASLKKHKYQRPGMLLENNFKRPNGLMRKPQTDLQGYLEDGLGCPPDPCSNPCTNPSPCCKRQCPSTKRPYSSETSESSEEVTPRPRPPRPPRPPQKPPTEKAPCSLKMNCNGQWKYMKGTPGIGHCYSLKCDTANLSMCSFILRGEMQTIECVGDGCIAACEGELCKSRCQGSCCHAKCYGRGCTASCKGNECTTKENSHVLRNGQPFIGPMMARHLQICGAQNVARSVGTNETEKKERNLVYFDMNFDADSVDSLLRE